MRTMWCLGVLLVACDSKDDSAGTGESDTDTDTDSDTDTVPEDVDKDGFTVDKGDCDDANASVYPGAKDPICDGIDNDCDGTTEVALIGTTVYDDLQDALDDAAEGDTVLVCPGTHEGGFKAGRSMTIESYSGDRTTTILDGEGKETVLALKPSSSFVLRGLTIQNGWDSYDSGGIRASGVASLLVDDCAIVDNYADYEGGGIEATIDSGSSGTVEIKGSLIARNESGYTGGGAVFGITWDPITVLVEDSVFDENVSGYEGGGVTMDCDDGTGDFSYVRTSFTNNTATYEGGGTHIGSWGVATLSYEDCDASGNEAPTGAAYNFHLAGDHKLAGGVTITGGSVTMNGLISGTYGALFADEWWQIGVKDVDFGEGVTDNDVDVADCPKSYGAKTSFSYAPGLGIYCE
jgi:hypothetical protein